MRNAYQYSKKLKDADEFGNLLHTARDWYTQGMQLNKVYLEDWNEIKATFAGLGLRLNEHGPILTIDGVKNVRLALKLSENTRGYLQKDVFLTTLASLPIYCRHLGAKKFEEWMDTIEFEHLMDLRGTMKEKDAKMEEIVETIFLRKKDRSKKI